MVRVLESNKLWNSLDELGKVLQRSYSVTGKEAIRKQYMNQVKQYPLYLKWFEKISSAIPKNKNLIIIEYGSGPGLLAKKIINNHKVKEYIIIEPERIFREMTRKITDRKVKIIASVAEEFKYKKQADFIIATATYHHMYDKLRSLSNIYKNLKKGGKLILGEVFIPEYSLRKDYNPADKVEFVEKVLSYVVEQIISMPNPKREDIIDQIKTAFLDILRIEESKVCISVLKKQLKAIGFKDIKVELMKTKSKKINNKNLGWYFITAIKK